MEVKLDSSHPLNCPRRLFRIILFKWSTAPLHSSSLSNLTAVKKHWAVYVPPENFVIPPTSEVRAAAMLLQPVGCDKTYSPLDAVHAIGGTLCPQPFKIVSSVCALSLQ